MPRQAAATWRSTAPRGPSANGSAGALDQSDVEDALYAAAERNGLVADDGQPRTWATIPSGLGKGLLEPKNRELLGQP